MDEFWVGKQGTLEEDERTALQDSGVDVEDLRRMTASTGSARDWWTLRTFVSVPAADEFAARTRVAQVLELDADDLVAYSADIFR